MTQPHRHNSLDPDPARRLSEHILARTNNGRTIFEVFASIARGDDPRATRKDRIRAARAIIEYQDRFPHIFQDPQSP